MSTKNFSETKWRIGIKSLQSFNLTLQVWIFCYFAPSFVKLFNSYSAELWESLINFGILEVHLHEKVYGWSGICWNNCLFWKSCDIFLINDAGTWFVIATWKIMKLSQFNPHQQVPSLKFIRTKKLIFTSAQCSCSTSSDYLQGKFAFGKKPLFIEKAQGKGTRRKKCHYCRVE